MMEAVVEGANQPSDDLTSAECTPTSKGAVVTDQHDKTNEMLNGVINKNDQLSTTNPLPLDDQSLQNGGSSSTEVMNLCPESYFPSLPGEQIQERGLCHQGLLLLTNYRLAIVHTTSSSVLQSLVTSVEENDTSVQVNGVPISVSSPSPSLPQHPCVKQCKTLPVQIVPVNALWKVDILELVHLRITTKTGHLLKVTFSHNPLCQQWLTTISKLMQRPLYSLDTTFAFLVHSKIHHEGAQWRFLSELHTNDSVGYDILEEFCRLGFSPDLWRISSINQHFELCKSYPEWHIVPKTVDDQSLKNMAPFRQSNRFPSVVWRSPRTGAVLLRSGQPCVGFTGYRNEDDERFIAAVIACCQEEAKQLLPPGNEPTLSVPKGLLIVDARNYSAAFYNCFRGGGFENIQNYRNVEIEWKNLPNMHSVRASFEKLILCIHTCPDQWLSSLQSTEWLNYMAQVLKASYDVVQTLHTKSTPVMIHCTDGWDRTPQLTSLVQIMLDPWYRTIHGFRVLVEREWLSFGHKFADRCGLRTHSLDMNEISPIFLQFLDCVYQLYHQFPEEFEFNQTFLVKLGHHVYSTMFGTFLCNSLLDRIRSKVDSHTYSIWSFLNCQRNESIVNFLYKQRRAVLVPSWSIRDLILWRSMYCEGSVQFGDANSHQHRPSVSTSAAHCCHNNMTGVMTTVTAPSSHIVNQIPMNGMAVAGCGGPGASIRGPAVGASHHPGSTVSEGAAEDITRRDLLEASFTPPAKMETVMDRSSVTLSGMPNEMLTTSVMSRSMSLPNIMHECNSTDSTQNVPLERMSLKIDMGNNECNTKEDVMNIHIALACDEQTSPPQSPHSLHENGSPPPVAKPRKVISETSCSPLCFPLPTREPLTRQTAFPVTSDPSSSTSSCLLAQSQLQNECDIRCSPLLHPLEHVSSVNGGNNILSNSLLGEEGTSYCAMHHFTAGSHMHQDVDGLACVSLHCDPYNALVRHLKQQQNYEKLWFDQACRKLLNEAQYWQAECQRLKSHAGEDSVPLQDHAPPPNEPMNSFNSCTSFVKVESEGFVKWIPDHLVSTCGLCHVKFTYCLRKHHCRNCGHIFCYDCCKFYLHLPNASSSSKLAERVCRNCYQSLTARSRPVSESETELLANTIQPPQPSISNSRALGLLMSAVAAPAKLVKLWPITAVNGGETTAVVNVSSATENTSEQ